MRKEVAQNAALIRFLDHAGVPWRSTVGDIADRYGISNDPLYQWPCLSMPAGRFLDGMRSPLNCYFQDEFAARYPATYFSCPVYVSDDEHVNLRHVEAQLVPFLGRGRKEISSNAISRIWEEKGVGSITAIIWPRELNKHHHNRPNPAEQRNPFLVSSCSVSLRLSYIMQATDAEREEVRSFRLLHTCVEAKTPSYDPRHHQRQANLEFLKHTGELTPAAGAIGISDAGSLILSSGKEASWIFPRDRILSIALDCIPPERGGYDNFELSLAVANDFNDSNKRFMIASQYRHPDETRSIMEQLRPHFATKFQ